MEFPIEFAFMRGGCGWSAECLNSPESPPLAARLAKAFNAVGEIWKNASATEREEFWKWAETE